MSADPLEEMLSRWRGAGLLTPSQAEAIRSYESLRKPEPQPEPERQAEALPTPEPASPAPVVAGNPPPRGPRPAGRAAFFLQHGIDARALGAILAALALLALVGAVFALATDVVVAPGRHLATDVEDVIHAVAAGLGLTGGLRMAGGRRDGRRLALISLGLNLAVTVAFGPQHLREWMTAIPVLVWMVLAWLTWNARFDDTAVATRSQLS